MLLPRQSWCVSTLAPLEEGFRRVAFGTALPFAARSLRQIAAAAIIGGIAMFHKLAYFLLSENEKITCAAFDACVARGSVFRVEAVLVLFLIMPRDGQNTAYMTLLALTIQTHMI